VSRSELVKGYAVDEGLYVTGSDEGLQNLKLESNGAIQIERFVPEAEIDRVHGRRPTIWSRRGRRHGALPGHP
jgi:non-homologous end joining protein Ku